MPIRLNTSETGSTFECSDNARPLECSAGRWELTDATAGRHVFTARTIEFFVPENLERRKGFNKRLNRNYFAGDALFAKRRGLRLVLPRTKVVELQLLAPTAPSFGKVRSRVGKTAWHTVNLAGPKTALTQFIVIDRYSGIRRVKIVIETLSNKPVRLDAIVARPKTFPASQRTEQTAVSVSPQSALPLRHVRGIGNRRRGIMTP